MRVPKSHLSKQGVSELLTALVTHSRNAYFSFDQCYGNPSNISLNDVYSMKNGLSVCCFPRKSTQKSDSHSRLVGNVVGYISLKVYRIMLKKF